MAVINIVPVNLAPVSFNLVSIQFGLSLQGAPTAGKIGDLSRCVNSVSQHHKLFKPDTAILGSVTRFAATLTDQEIDLLTTKISDQNGYFWNYYVGGLLNVRKFLQKTSNDCYCDLFTPEPKVYNGHLAFHPSENLNAVLRAAKDEVAAANPNQVIPNPRLYQDLTEVSTSNTYYIGHLKFKIKERTSTVEVKMNRRHWKSVKALFQINPGKMERVRSSLSIIQRIGLAVVDIDVRPVGKIFHSYSLNKFFEKLNGTENIYYQTGNEFMVAGDNGYSRFEKWCV